MQMESVLEIETFEQYFTMYFVTYTPRIMNYDQIF
jgi:hypothetical protein